VIDFLRIILIIPFPFAGIFFVGILFTSIGAAFSKDVRQLHFADGQWIFLLIVWIVAAIIFWSEVYLISIA